MSQARKFKNMTPAQPIRQTRTRSKLQNAPPLMKGLDDRGQPIDALTKDPENITYVEVLQKVREDEDFSAKSTKSHESELRRDRSVFDDPSLAGRAGIGGWADWSGYTEEEASIYEASGYTFDPTKNKPDSNSSGSSSDTTNGKRSPVHSPNHIFSGPTAPIFAASTSAAPSPARNRADSCSSSGSSDIANGKESPRQSGSASPVHQAKEDSPVSPSFVLSPLSGKVITSNPSSSKSSSDQVRKRKRSDDDEGSVSEAKKRCPSEGNSSSPMSPANHVKEDDLLVLASTPKLSFTSSPSSSESSNDQVRKSGDDDDDDDDDKNNEDSAPGAKKRRSSTSRDLTPGGEETKLEPFTAQIPGLSFINKSNDYDEHPQPEMPGLYGSALRPRLHYDWYEQYHRLGLDCAIVHGCRLGPYCHECHAKWHKDWARFFRVQEEIEIALENPETYQDAHGNEIEMSSNELLRQIINAIPSPPKGGKVRIHPTRMAKERLLEQKRE